METKFDLPESRASQAEPAPLTTDIVLRCLAALAQEKRLAIFRQLIVAGPSGTAAGELAHETATPAATLSFHLKELAHAGLVVAKPRGRFIFYAAQFAQMRGVLDYLLQNCCAADGDGLCGPAAACPSSCAVLDTPLQADSPLASDSQAARKTRQS